MIGEYGRALRFSRIAFRTVAIITLLFLGAMVICEKFYPFYGHVLVNSQLGLPLTLWVIVPPLLLPLYVVFEAWWMHKCKVASSALWIDVGLAVVCFLMLMGIVLYAFGHYTMI
jgi:hypothetical protein